MINTPEDTIVAISTPLGEGAIGIVRISGPRAIDIAEEVFFSPKVESLRQTPSHTVHYGYITDGKEKVDEVLLTIMRAPRTYTREDVVEINCHGGVVPLRRILELVIKKGARLASPGEFTLRAFLNGRIDLSQAEAVLDIIRSRTERSERIALEQLSGRLSEKVNALADSLTNLLAHIEAYIDFPEEDINPQTESEMKSTMNSLISEIEGLISTYKEGRLLKEGASIAIVGRPNVGKSSLLNVLLQRDRAIVTSVPGTTRDLLEEDLNIEGIPVRIIDTAGIRESSDPVEEEGIKRTLTALERADLVIALFDSSEPLQPEDHSVLERVKDYRTIYVLNKTDLPSFIEDRDFPVRPLLRVSALKERGIENLRKTIVEQLRGDSTICSEGIIITNLRHKAALEKAKAGLKEALNALHARMPLEIVSLELRLALESLEEITGQITNDDILNRIFGQFCIGK